MDITLTILQSVVLAEVERKTGYVGAKKVGDEDAYDRISTVDVDYPELKSLWDECRTELTQAVEGMLVSEGMDTDNDTYNLVLNVDDSFNVALQPSLLLNLFYFFVYGIIARWYMYTNKEEAEAYAKRSASSLYILTGIAIKRAFTRMMYPL